MIRVLALTQFAFLTLGIVSLKIVVHANPSASPSSYPRSVSESALWLFAVPLLWIAFASVCGHVGRSPLTLPVAQVVGVLIAIGSFLFLLSVTFH